MPTGKFSRTALLLSQFVSAIAGADAQLVYEALDEYKVNVRTKAVASALGDADGDDRFARFSKFFKAQQRNLVWRQVDGYRAQRNANISSLSQAEVVEIGEAGGVLVGDNGDVLDSGPAMSVIEGSGYAMFLSCKCEVGEPDEYKCRLHYDYGGDPPEIIYACVPCEDPPGPEDCQACSDDDCKGRGLMATKNGITVFDF